MNYLFVLGSYYPKPSANGICAEKIIGELTAKGNDVSVVTTNIYSQKGFEVINGVDVYRIKDKFIYSNKFKNSNIIIRLLFGKIHSVINGIKLIFGYPYSVTRVYRLGAIVEKLIREKNIDTVVSVIQPVETMVLLKKIKKKYKQINTISYNLDILSEKGIPKSLSKLFQIKTEKFYCDINNYTDIIVNMDYSKEYYNKKCFEIYKDKMFFTDIPSFKKLESDFEITDWDPKAKHIVFSGSLSKTIRNPKKILDVFCELKNKNFVLHFYSKGCEDILEEAKEKLGDKIVLHGYVSTDEVYAAVLKSDMLLNISNKTTYQIPSKIFEYFSTGKKIISYLYSENDPAVKYYSKYKNMFYIYDDLNKLDLQELEDFIYDEKYTAESFEELYTKYYNNTPEHVVKIFEKIL